MNKLNYPLAVKNAWKLACKVRQNAYAPYSKFLVGSSLKFMGSPKIFSGCNYENASFGATICAERNALGSAIASGESKKKLKLDFVVIVTNTTVPTPPCGLCLQALSEFVKADTMVYLANPKKIVLGARFNQFLPTPFNKIELL